MKKKEVAMDCHMQYYSQIAKEHLSNFIEEHGPVRTNTHFLGMPIEEWNKLLNSVEKRNMFLWKLLNKEENERT